MTLPTTWNPLRQLARFDPFADMEDMMRTIGRRSPLAREMETAMEMRLDINEDDASYIVNVDMPGVRKEDIDVSVEGRHVAIRATVDRDVSRGKGKEMYSERFSGQGYRALTLPGDVDVAKAKAAYDGGVLCLTLPKKSGAAAKHLSVN